MSDRLTAAERAERIMSVVPWLVDADGVELDQICERFQLTRAELVDDLNLLFFNVGVHPFTPDVMVTVLYTDDDGADVESDDAAEHASWVSVELGDWFRRPLRLTSDEALSILAAGQALVSGHQADETLRSALAKLATAVGPGGGDVLDVQLGSADPAVLSTVRRAVDRGVRLDLQYHSFARDAVTQRTVEPHLLTSRDGYWYLQAHCLEVDAVRLFRLDRMRDATETETPIEHPVGPMVDAFDFGESQQVELVLQPQDSWVASQYPTVSTEELDDGRSRVVLNISALPWLERLLLRLDPATEARDAVSGASLDTVRAEAARRLISRYR
jgi:proteasome accessory factor C